MLFKPYLAKAIIQGKKTQTRKLKNPMHSTVISTGHIIAIYTNNKTTTRRSNRLLWRVENTYAIQPGRGKNAIARFRLLAIRQEPLQTITARDARAEGIEYANPTQAFTKLWDDIHTTPGTRWQDNPHVFVLTFELVTK